ncbi:MAG: prepilin-type N-terminal cleavage/methylation domain-containing protein [Gemmatimonadales bacterium]
MMRGGLRSGFTLVEVMVALVLLGMVSVVLYQTLVSTQRVTDALHQRGKLQSGLRAGGLAVPGELQQLTIGTSSTLDSVSDISAITDTSITYRAMRGYYVVCEAPASATTLTAVRVAPSAFTSEYRSPLSTDSAFVFWEGDTLTANDDAWIPVGISAVATTTCTYPSSPATTKAAYTVGLAGSGIPSAYPLNKLYPGAPIRTFESDQLILYASGGAEWLGISVDGATAQPVLGPLVPASGSVRGFQLSYYDSTGASLTAVSTSIPRIRTIGVMLRGVTSAQVAAAGRTRALIYDSLLAVVTLRNAPRN